MMNPSNNVQGGMIKEELRNVAGQMNPKQDQAMQENANQK